MSPCPGLALPESRSFLQLIRSWERFWLDSKIQYLSKEIRHMTGFPAVVIRFTPISELMGVKVPVGADVTEHSR